MRLHKMLTPQTQTFNQFYIAGGGSRREPESRWHGDALFASCGDQADRKAKSNQSVYNKMPFCYTQTRLSLVLANFVSCTPKTGADIQHYLYTGSIKGQKKITVPICDS